MLHIPKIDDCLKFLTDEVVKDFLVMNFSEYFKSIRKEQNLGKVAKWLNIFLTCNYISCNQILLIIV